MIPKRIKRKQRVFRVGPHWTMEGRAAYIQRMMASKKSIRDLKCTPFTFDGPGWYFLKSNNAKLPISLLIIPIESSRVITRRNIWSQRWPEDTRFQVNGYNCHSDETIFSALHFGTAPTRRMDE